MIESSFLGTVAGFINNYVSKVLLNGTVEITTFSKKEVRDNVLHLEYLVPAAVVSEVRLIQLQNAAGKTVSSNTVYVPISTDTFIKQSIEVSEVM
ncbi:ketopantoate hydroxymethyltransferase [Brevibacillus parabrevis]|uniref:ketopantoate hydroxymethyltransferase n=1 Tax=Brevibacillus parabrevis TaxID=54914 RepID=UPI002490A2BD|nr:ketopantoate hydroxymethyltransferase [Brevibacillus parabrevis]